MKNKFKIAIVQAVRDPFDYDKNTQKGLKIIEEAQKLGAELVLFPECWITGYEFPIQDDDMPIEEIEKLLEYEKWKEKALADDDIHIQAFRKLAKELEIGVVITGYTKGEKRPRNSAFVISKKGEVLMKYNKVHTCDFSYERMLEGGDTFKVCDFEGVKLGVMICYDREYPESARILMLKGAEIILVPNDCSIMEPRVNALSTRAYENMTGVVMANPPGENAGRSCAFSPIIWDEEGHYVDPLMVCAGELEEDIFIAEYDLDALRNYRSSEMMGNTFRKVHAYAELLKDEVHEPFIR
ncbi:MAG: carbon-nitrogen hydrolase family protein [Candidatus Niameybacter stercoravium]|nr:carbon-nitrogen hydrolase family protein [Candidatus Niameybacter stercoravium]